MSLLCNHLVPYQMIILVIISVATSRLSRSAKLVPSFAIIHGTISELIVFMRGYYWKEASKDAMKLNWEPAVRDLDSTPETA